LQVRCYALPSVRRRLAHRMDMFSVAELETNVEGEEDWWIECRSYNSTWRAKRHIFWSWALYRAGMSVVRVSCSARKFRQYAVWCALLISTGSMYGHLRYSQCPYEVMHSPLRKNCNCDRCPYEVIQSPLRKRCSCRPW
jgi:hypothetical protein